ncbi:hypothetical protein H2198_006278 [Neophaeococcomyces mojaviensis]|uniref:Uncharacterized protein n=1 Tax=Neophaeococcomyces mojaviensis TaxID=3383035 RepID=A0ACC3A3A3_9EURO|nr:hypothetical protein H2198_006278 [Knufia sp. JES_112]
MLSPSQEQVVKIQIENCPNAIKVRRDALASSKDITNLGTGGDFAMNGSNNELLKLSDDDDDPIHYVELVIGDVQTGTYDFHLNFNGHVDYAAILGGDGYVHSR